MALRNPNPATNGGFDYAAVIRWYDDGDTFWSQPSPNTTGASFSDSRINGGSLTYGILETLVGTDSVTAVRLVFNNTSTAAPTLPLEPSYDAFVPGSGTSPVPEPGAVVTLGTLCAAGLLLRKRRGKA